MNFKYFNYKTSLFYFLLLQVLSFSQGCKNKEDQLKIVDEYHNFIRQLSTDTSNHSDDYWQVIELNFNSKDSSINNIYPKLDEKQRKRVDSLRMGYIKIKQQYALRKEEQRLAEEKRKQEAVFRKKIFTKRKKASGIINKEIMPTELSVDFKQATNKNIADYFEIFLENVKQHKENYTPADWDMAKAVYEEMDSRKDEVEDMNGGISPEDKKRITKIKIEYAAIRIPGRIDAKVQEKRKAGKAF